MRIDLNVLLQRIFKFFVFLIVFCSSAYSQDVRNQSVFLELLGNGGLYSINYEYNFYQDFNSRAGFSFYSGIAGTVVAFPIMLNHFKKDAKFSPEFGFGFLTGIGKGSPLNSESSKSKLFVVLTATLGMRFISSDNEDLIRIGYTPFFSPEKNKYLNFGGLSFGIRF